MQFVRVWFPIQAPVLDGKVFTCNVCNQIIKSGSDLKDHLHQDTNAELPMEQIHPRPVVPDLVFPEEKGSIETKKGKNIEIIFRNRQVRLVQGPIFSKGQLYNPKLFNCRNLKKEDFYLFWCWHLLILSHCVSPRIDITVGLTSFNIHSVCCYNPCGYHPHTLSSFLQRVDLVMR